MKIFQTFIELVPLIVITNICSLAIALEISKQNELKSIMFKEVVAVSFCRLK